MRIACCITHVVQEVQIALVSDRNDLGVSHLGAFRKGDSDDCVDDRSRLGDERDVARQRRSGNIRRIEFEGRKDQTKTVRTDDTDTVVLGDLDHTGLKRPSILVHLLESCGDNDRHLHAFLAALAHDRRNELSRNGDNDHIHVTGDSRESRVAFDALDLVAFVVHRVDFAGELENIAEHRVSHFGRIIGSTDHGDASRFVVVKRNDLCRIVVGRKFDRFVLNDDACIDCTAALLVESEGIDIELNNSIVLLKERTGVL